MTGVHIKAVERIDATGNADRFGHDEREGICRQCIRETVAKLVNVKNLEGDVIPRVFGFSRNVLDHPITKTKGNSGSSLVDAK